MTSGTGTCTVNYDQAGNANYNAAPQVTESVTAQKASQTITFAPLPDKTYGDPDFTVSATSDSGLAVSFGATGSCTVSGTTVHLTGPGSCTVTASQPGNGNYSAAADVPRTFQVNAPAETVARLTGKDATCTQVTGGTAATLSSVAVRRQERRDQEGDPEPGRLLGQGAPLGRFAHGRSRPGDHVGQLHPEADPRQRQQGVHRGLREGQAADVHERPGGSVTAGLNAAATGDYWIAVRYQVSAINGQADSGADHDPLPVLDRGRGRLERDARPAAAGRGPPGVPSCAAAPLRLELR